MSRISVVIPARNAGAFLGDALDSVFAQGLDAPEVVVVDDGSTDDTVRVARSYGRGVEVLSQPQSGSGRARNTGLEATSGDLVAFLDADDIWTADKSALQLPVLEQDPRTGLVFADVISFQDGRQQDRTFFEEREFDGRCVPSSIFLYDIIFTSTVILRRTCLDAVGQFDGSLAIGQDTDLWLRIALEFPFAVVNRPLVKRRLHASNVTRDNRLLVRFSREIWGRYADRCIEKEPEMRQRLVDELARKRWEHGFVEGCCKLREGRPREARRHLGEAIRVAPLRPRPYAFYLLTYLGAVGRALRRPR
jgi:glycosyltransferase involved in cell wall biosynthesis